MLPHLAQCAKEQRLITYGELGKLVDVYPLYMTKPLDVLRDRILVEHRLPRIDALVVNQDTKEVGDSFYEGGFGNLSLDDRRSLLDAERAKVFQFPDWETVIERLRNYYGA